MNRVIFVVPEGIDDPERPSGGNRYDRRIADGLAAHGWVAHVVEIDGAWPTPGPASAQTAQVALSALPDGSVVVVDGLLSPGLADQLIAHARRLRLVLLVHMPQGGSQEERVVASASAVIATSAWTQRWLTSAYATGPERMHVIAPGVDDAELVAPSTAGGRLLCVAAVTPHKGHDVLVEALSLLGRGDWECVCVGSEQVDPGFAERVRAQRDRVGLTSRLRFVGPLTGPDLTTAYRRADLLVAPSLMETYGMVVTEALAHGLPVVASDVGGVSEALGTAPDGSRPGILVPAADPGALAVALQIWLDDDRLRARLRAAARARRTTLTGWGESSGRLARVLNEVAA